MDLLKDDLKKVFRHYLSASMGSAVVVSVYAFVDAIAVGQSEGPDGAAAMAVINPLYGVIVFLALMCGIGGSVMMSAAWGEGKREEGNRWFSCAMALMGMIVLLAWILLAVFHEAVFTLFGADAALMPLVMKYAWWLIGFLPLMLASIFLACFIRNDGNPGLAMKAVLIGGGANIFGDWFLVFFLKMGISGAGLATVISNLLQTVILCSHFFGKKNHMKLMKVDSVPGRVKQVCAIGFGAGMLDLANVFLFCILNNQLMKYGGVRFLAVFGAVSTMSSLFQSLFSGVGQALQPVASVNFGAKEMERVRQLLKMSIAIVVPLGLLFSMLGILCPGFVVRLLMDATPEVLELAPDSVRPFSVIFLFMGINVVATYYLQSTLQAKKATTISLLRGLIISGVFILVFPLVFPAESLWYAMPAAELLVCLLAVVFLCRKES